LEGVRFSMTRRERVPTSTRRLLALYVGWRLATTERSGCGEAGVEAARCVLRPKTPLGIAVTNQS